MPTYNRQSGDTRFQKRSAAKLGLPSAWLDGELNSVYSILNSLQLTANASEWSLGTTSTYVAANQFTVAGDQRSVYVVGRAIEANINGTKYYTRVSAVAYTSLTTVTLKDAVLTNALTAISYGIINIDAAKPSLPIIWRTIISGIIKPIDTSRSGDIVYLADTDLFIATYWSIAHAPYPVATLKTDANNPPTTIVAKMTASGGFQAASFVVRKGNYWKLENCTQADGIWVFPIGS